MEWFFNMFHSAAPNHVLMFARLFCITLSIQMVVNFKSQLYYFKTQPKRVYGMPVKLLGIYQLPALSENQFIFFGGALTFSLLLAVFSSYANFFFFVAFFCYFPYFNSIMSLAAVQRKTNLIPIVLLILAISPSTNQTITGASSSWEIVLIKIAIVQMYFSSGLQKLMRSGLSWCSGKSLQAYLLENYLWSDSRGGLLLAQNLKLCSVLSGITLFFELTFGLILFAPQFTFIYITIALLFHLGTWLTMRINYLKYLLPVYMVFFIDAAFWIKDRL
jgi:hypothetical protein